MLLKKFTHSMFFLSFLQDDGDLWSIASIKLFVIYLFSLKYETYSYRIVNLSKFLVRYS